MAVLLFEFIEVRIMEFGQTGLKFDPVEDIVLLAPSLRNNLCISGCNLTEGPSIVADIDISEILAGEEVGGVVRGVIESRHWRAVFR